MIKEIKKYSFLVIQSDFPVITIKKFLNNEKCKKIIKEIKSFRKYDDFVMNGRKRINKGSENFNQFIKKSKYSKKLLKYLNNKSYLINLIYFLEKELNITYLKNIISKIKFSKKNYGLQDGMKLSKIKYQNPTANLDMDFSVSEKGYYRGPHRDRETRLINFLIYLNTLPKKAGGGFEIYKNKNCRSNNFKRFPTKKQLILDKTIQPKAGQIIFFISQPNSYHAVSKLVSKKNRYFIYGSYSLDRKINWNKLKTKNKFKSLIGKI